MRQGTLIIGLAAIVVGNLAYAGTLTPPGAPAGTMKPLSQVEGRTPITSLPYTISTPGSYYLAASLSLATQDTDGITINAGNVTLDLNGYALIGPGKTAGTTGHGVYVSLPAVHNIAVIHGAVTAWREDGVDVTHTLNARLVGLQATNNGQTGLVAGQSAHVAGNTSVLNGAHGIGANYGSTIIGNACRANGADGINATSGGVIKDNACYQNGDTGIGLMNRSVVCGNSASENDGAGIMGGHGNLIESNTVEYNDENGIYVDSTNRIVNNHCSCNGYGDDAGIMIAGDSNVVEGNSVVLHMGAGIKTRDATDTDNYFASNRAQGNTTDFAIGAGNTQGSGDLANVSF